ncbi:inner membrane protein yieG [Thozetella sp. PMI_491]|nr:inner membrane protein yieG [Thozetella sp. PMI_491]
MSVRSWVSKLHNTIESINDMVGKSVFGRLWRLKQSGHATIEDALFLTELRAGLTTFSTMAYIISVNATILTDTGGTCECRAGPSDPLCENDSAYAICQIAIQRDLITATAILSGISSIVFGLFTNLPVCLAPGMGLNAYFAYQVVGYHGSGMVSYRLALTAVFVEGFIFMGLALTGMRQWLCQLIPSTIKTASGVGIGLFLTLIGMSYSAGIGLITPGGPDPLALGGCPPEMLDPETGVCQGGRMTNPTMWLGILAGGTLTVFLLTLRIKSAILIGIVFVSILSWPRGTTVTYFPYTEAGESRWNFFKQVVAFHPIQNTLAAQQWKISGGTGTQFVLALMTFLYVDIIDCTATLYSMARFARKSKPTDRDFPRSTIAYCIDAMCISFGALLGSSPVTAFIESGSGISQGGRTGLTAITCGLCFLIAAFFAPIFASIPPWATGCSLILVGCLMMRQVVAINWRYMGDAIPSFVTLAMIPFSYSVAYGLIGGLFMYTLLNGMLKLVMIASRGRIQPENYDLKEYWNWKPSGKPIILRAITQSGRFWSESQEL